MASHRLWLQDKTVQVWEVSSGRLLRTYSGHSDLVWTLAWSPDGSRIASGSWDKTVQVWEVSSGRLLRTYSGHSDWVYTLAWSPDGSRIASGSDDKTVQVWEVSSGRLCAPIAAIPTGCTRWRGRPMAPASPLAPMITRCRCGKLNDVRWLIKGNGIGFLLKLFS